MVFQTVEAILSANVAASGTVTLPYPGSSVQADFDPAEDHLASVAGAVLSTDDSDFSLTFGASTITFTNGATNFILPKGDVLRVQMIEFDTTITVAAGGDGQQGFVDIFPATQSKGKSRFKGNDNAGDTTTQIVIATQAAARVYTVPDAGADADFLMDEVAQTIGGVKTFTLAPVVPAIEGSDASLGIVGKADAQGGVATVKGGTSSTGGNAGGIGSVVGGVPGVTGVGGKAQVTGGIGGSTSGKGGDAEVVGGVGTDGDADGGDVLIEGGLEEGTGAPGVVNIAPVNTDVVNIGHAAATITNKAPPHNTANIGTVPGTVTAVEYGDGYNHVTVLTVTAAVLVPDIPADAEEVGALIYTFPAGVHQVHSVHMDITAITSGNTGIPADIGCGSTLAAGDGTTLGAATDEDFLDGQTIAAIQTPATEKSLAADGTVFESGNSKLFHLNLAANWGSAEADPDITGTVTIRWSYLGA
jgi:hypothetical protein